MSDIVAVTEKATFRSPFFLPHLSFRAKSRNLSRAIFAKKDKKTQEKVKKMKKDLELNKKCVSLQPVSENTRERKLIDNNE